MMECVTSYSQDKAVLAIYVAVKDVVAALH